MKKRKIFILVFFIVNTIQIFSQKSLQVLYTQFGKEKKKEFFINDHFDYKIKGRVFFHENRIADLRDSSIVLANDSVIKINQLKAVRIHKGGHLLRTIQEVFLIGGIGFIALNTANNGINGTTPLIDSKAVYVSGALLGTGIIIRLCSTRCVKVGKNKSAKLLITDFTKVNTGD